MQNLQDLEMLLLDLNKNMEEIENSNEYEYKGNDIPMSIRFMMNGINSTNAISFLFSDGVDRLLDSLMNMIESDKIEKFLTNEDNIKAALRKIGFGSGQFKGELSKKMINNIQNTVSSKRFEKTKSFTLKVLRIVKNLKKESRQISNPEKKKKFDDMIYAITQIVKIINNVWKNRKVINDRMKQGLNNIITEEQEFETIKIIPIV